VGEALSQAISEFNCVPGDDQDDPVAETVCTFLRTGKFEAGIRAGFSSTYLFVDPDVSPELVGYATLTFDSIRLTNSEKQKFEDLAGIRQFGALRIQMIGVDTRHHGRGYGKLLLESITGVARQLRETVACRYILADANQRRVEWYESRGFVPNRARAEIERLEEGGRSVSMRFDLLDLPDS
jgi:ribosomal protein S18 acetylase RimI-like enzyme